VAVARCSDCRILLPSYAEANAVAIYTGVARDALLAFKLRGERRAARAMARRMASIAPHADLVTFVPSTRRARVQRGFDPAEELARPLARAIGVPCRRIVRKTKETADQAGLPREARLKNVAGAFEASGGPGTVLLVDDVMTTGATAEACARALVASGIGKVAVLTFARAG